MASTAGASGTFPLAEAGACESRRGRAPPHRPPPQGRGPSLADASRCPFAGSARAALPRLRERRAHSPPGSPESAGSPGQHRTAPAGSPLRDSPHRAPQQRDEPHRGHRCHPDSPPGRPLPDDQGPERLPAGPEPARGLSLREQNRQPPDLRVQHHQGQQEARHPQHHQRLREHLPQPSQRHHAQEPGVPPPAELHHQRRGHLHVRAEGHQRLHRQPDKEHHRYQRQTGEVRRLQPLDPEHLVAPAAAPFPASPASRGLRVPVKGETHPPAALTHTRTHTPSPPATPPSSPPPEREAEASGSRETSLCYLYLAVYLTLTTVPCRGRHPAPAPLRSMGALLGTIASPIAPPRSAGWPVCLCWEHWRPQPRLSHPFNSWALPLLSWGETAGLAAELEVRPPPDTIWYLGAAPARATTRSPRGAALSCDERIAASTSGGKQSLSELATAPLPSPGPSELHPGWLVGRGLPSGA